MAGRGMPNLPRCKATDWLQSISSSFKIFSHLESVLSFWMVPPLFRCLKV